MAPGLKQVEIIPFRVAAYDTKVGEMAFFGSSKTRVLQVTMQ